MNKISRLNVASAIIRAFKTDIPFLKLGSGEGAIFLAKRAAGEQIDDPECETVGEALRSGIFRRFRVSRDGQKDFRWLYLCSTDSGELASSLSGDFDEMEERGINHHLAGISFQC